MKLDSFLFHPKDWISDSKLGLCSYATKGAWMDIICYMHMGDKYGHLIVDGKPLQKDDVFNLLKFRNREEFEFCWNELVSNGVMKYDKDTSSFFSKRLIEDRQRLMKSVKYNPISQGEIEFAKQVISSFEKITSKKDNNVNDSIRLIVQLKRNGYSLEHFDMVVKHMYNKWKDQDKMVEYIRPITLFKMDKFSQYLSSAVNEGKVENSSSQKKVWNIVDPMDI